MTPSLPGGAATPWTVIELGVTDSTQAEAKRRLRDGDRLDRTVVRASEQRAGQGRRGRAFTSQAGGSYQSLAVADPHGTFRSGATTLALAVGLAEAFEARRIAVRVKWPNDLIDARGLKCGGLLAEHVRDHLITGVGVNVGTAPEGFGALDAPLEVVHQAVLEGVDRGLAVARDTDRLPAAYVPWDALRGRTVTVVPSDASVRQGHVTGVAQGVTADGALRIATPEGPVMRVSGGTIRTVDPPLG